MLYFLQCVGHPERRTSLCPFMAYEYPASHSRNVYSYLSLKPPLYKVMVLTETEFSRVFAYTIVV